MEQKVTGACGGTGKKWLVGRHSRPWMIVSDVRQKAEGIMLLLWHCPARLPHEGKV